MSLYGMMRTGVSGMSAQATRLGTVADNIANSGTNGYKRASVEFSSLIVPNSGTSYVSGSVSTQVRYAISDPGNIQYTTSATDLAIDGDGFFVVQDANGSPFLTRAGSFVPDGEGRLVNAAGFYLMGYSYANGVPSPVANGYAGLEPVTISGQELTATPTTSGTFSANLPYTAPVWNGGASGTALPSNNDLTPADLQDGLEDGSIVKSSLIVYNNVGEEALVDIYFTKTAPNQWEVTTYNHSDAAAGGSFPYTGLPLTTPAPTLTFDPTTGELDVVGGSPSTFNIDLSGFNGDASIELDLSSMTQLATEYTPGVAEVNGNAPSAVDQVLIGEDGNIYAQYANGSMTALYRLPLANVQSPDQLNVLPGNVFSPGLESGDVRIGFPSDGALGSIISGAVENSNVDIAEALTAMIQAQRNYTANSKVFQTGSDLMDVLVNLKR